MSTTGSSWSVGVVVPAHNEQGTIERCIESILTAARFSVRCGELWLVVVADSCSDRTGALARESVRHRGEVIDCAVRSPGAARKIGAAAVLDHFHHIKTHRLWMANTDADTTVPADWLEVHLAAADDNASAVAGIVDLDAEGLHPDVSRVYEETYAVNQDGTHLHVHGANLGVRADAYLDSGGWTNLSVAEDHSLWGRLRRNGWSVCSTVKSVVTTSARLHGRAVGGFADRLRSELMKQR